METRGLEKSGVPAEGGETLRDAFAVESFEELAFGIVSLQLRIGAR